MVFTKKSVKYWDTSNKASLKLVKKSCDTIIRVYDVDYLYKKEVSMAFVD
jgi:hypothetical protein